MSNLLHRSCHFRGHHPRTTEMECQLGLRKKQSKHLRVCSSSRATIKRSITTFREPPSESSSVADRLLIASIIPSHMLSSCPCHLNTATKSKTLGIPFAVALFCHHSPLTSPTEYFVPTLRRQPTKPIDQPLLPQLNRWPIFWSLCLATNLQLIRNGHLFHCQGVKRKKSKNTSSKKKTSPKG
jgi:hypothetical protein